MKTIFKYIVNTVIFLVFWALLFLPSMKYSLDYEVMSIAAIGGVIGIFISYRLVKRINKSNLWAKLFNVNVAVKDFVKEKEVDVKEEKIEKNFKEEKKGSYNWKLISIVTIIAAGLVYFNTFYFTEIPQETVNKDNELELINQKFIQAEKNGNLLLNRYNTWTDLNDPNADIATLKSTNQVVTGIVYGFSSDNGIDITGKWEIAFINGVREGLDKDWDANGNLISKKLFENNDIVYRRNFQDGLLISTDIYEKGSYKIKRTITH